MSDKFERLVERMAKLSFERRMLANNPDHYPRTSAYTWAALSPTSQATERAAIRAVLNALVGPDAPNPDPKLWILRVQSVAGKESTLKLFRTLGDALECARGQLEGGAAVTLSREP